MLAFGRQSDQLARLRPAEAESRFDDRLQARALPWVEIAVDLGDMDEQRDRGETKVIRFEIRRRGSLAREAREEAPEGFEHVAFPVAQNAQRLGARTYAIRASGSSAAQTQKKPGTRAPGGREP